MIERVICPPDYFSEIDGPVVFLAGPIQGADWWQTEAIRMITELDSRVYIACPRRKLGEEYKDGGFTDEMYAEQVDWETHHLSVAGNSGAVIFWLAKEAEHKCERAYAQTSRFELGEWKMRHQQEGANLIVGIENGFSNARYIKRRLSQDCPKVPILSTLEETCKTAVKMALADNSYELDC